MASYYVVVPCLCFGAWENVGMAGFLGTLTLPARCVRTRAIHSHAQCCVSKDPGVSLFGLALFYFHFKVRKICFSTTAISLLY